MFVNWIIPLWVIVAKEEKDGYPAVVLISFQPASATMISMSTTPSIITAN